MRQSTACVLATTDRVSQRASAAQMQHADCAPSPASTMWRSSSFCAVTREPSRRHPTPSNAAESTATPAKAQPNVAEIAVSPAVQDRGARASHTAARESVTSIAPGGVAGRTISGHGKVVATAGWRRASQRCTWVVTQDHLLQVRGLRSHNPVGAVCDRFFRLVRVGVTRWCRIGWESLQPIIACHRGACCVSWASPRQPNATCIADHSSECTTNSSAAQCGRGGQR